MRCSSCGLRNVFGAALCVHCGGELASEKEREPGESSGARSRGPQLPSVGGSTTVTSAQLWRDASDAEIKIAARGFDQLEPREQSVIRAEIRRRAMDDWYAGPAEAELGTRAAGVLVLGRPELFGSCRCQAGNCTLLGVRRFDGLPHCCGFLHS